MSNEFDFYNRIVSRWDAWAKQTTSPDKEGRYGYYCQKETLTRNTIDDSLLGDKVTIGAYTVKPVENTVTYPVIDIDNHDGLTNVKDDTKLIYNELVKIGLHPFIEGSGGGIETGAHVCLICKPTPAEEARKVLTGVLSDIDRKHHEVFPKQTSVNADGFGNLVKLPFQFNNRTKTRSQILNPETFEPMERQQAIEYLMKLPDSDIHGVLEKEIRDLNEAIKIQKEWDNNGRKPITPEAPKADNKTTSDEIEQFLSNPKIKPCVVQAYNNAWTLHGIGSEGNDFRVAIATELLSWDATDKALHEYFKIQDDYDHDKTQANIRWARGKTPTSCKKILEKCPTLLGNMCETCTYYKKSKPKQEREHKPKSLNTDDVEALKKGLGQYKTTRQLADEAQKVQPIAYDEYKSYWLWEKKLRYWRRIDETTILCCIDSLSSENVIDSKFKHELIEAFRITGRNRQLKPVPKEWLRFNDKVYDLKNKNTFEPNHDYFYTAPIPHNLGTSEDTPTIDAIFKSWVSNPLDLVEIAAYCLLDDYPIHRLFFILGSGGNGKGQFMDFLTRLVGINNTTSTDLVTILSSRFEAVKLYRRKVALIGETDYAKINQTDKLKKLTGDDLLQGEYKHKDPFDFKNTAKLIVSTNDLPETTDKTDAFYRRAFVTEFRSKFDDKGKSIIDTIPEKEYENFCLKCIRILGELLDRGRFTNEGTTSEKAEKYEKLSNPFGRFKESELNEDEQAETPVWILRDLYFSFIDKNGYRKISKTAFTQKLTGEGYEVYKKRYGEKTAATVIGLKPKKPFIYMDEDEYKSRENVPDVPLVPVVYNKLYIEKNIEPSGTSGTSGTNPIKNSDLCGFCGNPLNGNSEDLHLPGLGRTHPSCKREMWTIKALHDVPTFVCIDEVTRSIKADEVKSIPAYNAVVLINRKMATRVEA